eukprot:CAMPEP_0172529056 /NCGR_PEP_ID=MMETSP1067-20121228/3235_1 /TAXON_ID=265564 ORGANISM="Thalassiosira punctigera, Strain Tpunct2005C2" /NCGR_SAMPLE_ID=MMETSP1067 /ASSEMBLY_ACC=CAM_ASM_000444 /LENGTH=56 /DNA_ID=CAMNT_0013313045 /DNA_START=439 /DNA_END=606 /DNA_ORIENTATION=+
MTPIHTWTRSGRGDNGVATAGAANWSDLRQFADDDDGGAEGDLRPTMTAARRSEAA